MNEGGVITPNGEEEYAWGDNVRFEITADAGYRIKAIAVNGKLIDITDPNFMSYLFSNIRLDGTLEVEFEAIPSDEEETQE